MVDQYPIMEAPLLDKFTNAVNTGDTYTIEKDQWGSYFRDYRSPAFIHRFLEDALTGAGGFLGNVPISGDQAVSYSIGSMPFSYLVPDSTELQYLARVKNTEYYNDFARIVCSMSNPIFADGVISTDVMFDGEITTGDDFSEFLNDCTGTGVGYFELEKTAIVSSHVHDVSFVVMDRNANFRDMPYLRLYSVLDVVDGRTESDEYGRFVGIRFFTGRKIKINNVEYDEVIRYWMNGEYCYSALQYRDGDVWKNISAEVFSGINEMIVYPFQTGERRSGVIIPTIPKSYDYGRICADLYNKYSIVNWAMKICGFPIAYAYNVKNIKRSLGHIIQLGVSADGTPTPPPGFASPSTDGIVRGLEIVERLEMKMREIARKYGVMTVDKSTSQSQSGESKSYDFWATSETLKESVSQLRTLFSWVTRMYDLYENRSGYEYSRNYRSEFVPETEMGIETMYEGYRIASEVGAVEASKEIVKMIVMKITRGNVTRDRLAELTAEIDGLSVMADEFEQSAQEA